jgi:ribosomal protein L11 methyltransferase
VAEEDWAEAWKAHFKPVKVTDRLVIRPPWEEYAAQPGETVITIYPGMAFGTGRHASTLLCLRALEQVWEGQRPHSGSPWQVLDVGTGTGILALTAARYGAEVLAIDLDPEAVAAALENVRLNNLIDRVWVEETPLASLRQQFGLILANITAPDLLQLADSLTARLLSGGVLIISGFLTGDAPRLAARYQALGLHQTGFLTQEDWGALIFRRPDKTVIKMRGRRQHRAGTHNEGYIMKEFLQKAWLFGAGVFDFTKDKVEALVQEMVRRGEITQQESSEAVKQLLAKAQEAQQAMVAKVKELTKSTVDEIKVAKASDLEALEARVAALEEL